LPVDPKLAKQYAAEGVRIEGQLIGAGETPVTSVMETGQVDCKTATEFVDGLAAAKVMAAEQSLIGAVNVCPQAATAAQAKLDAGIAQGQLPPRAFMATAEHVGLSAPWSQSRFDRMLGALPDAKDAVKEAPDFAAMYAHMAPKVDRDLAKKTGLEMLDWLSKFDDVPERNLAIRIVAEGLKKTLGASAYEEALRGDLIAQQTANIKGSTEIEHPAEDNASVLNAMQQKGEDQTEALRGLPPVLRAKEAAASGFAEGTTGNKNLATKYFDIAYSALDEAWDSNPQQKNLAPTIEEVCEAAAQVDYIQALKRAQNLSSTAEQSIGMLAVARTVLGKAM
jgi:hypothetical protein